MVNAFSISRSSVLGLFTLITATSPPREINELLPPLNINMTVPASGHILLNPIQTLSKPPISALSGKDSFPSAGYDDTVIPSHHDARARTLVLCFDGTGDQFNADVRAYMLLSLLIYYLLTQCRPEFQHREFLLYAKEG